MATCPSGQGAVCKTAYTGSIPVVASTDLSASGEHILDRPRQQLPAPALGPNNTTFPQGWLTLAMIATLLLAIAVAWQGWVSRQKDSGAE
jgi:hypothetical protein